MSQVSTGWRALRQPGVALDGHRVIEGAPEICPEEGEEEQDLGGDEERHADPQALRDHVGVVAGAPLADHVPPPVDQRVGEAEHREQHHPGPAGRLVHVHQETDHQDQRRDAAVDRPRAGLDQMVGVVDLVVPVIGVGPGFSLRRHPALSSQLLRGSRSFEWPAGSTQDAGLPLRPDSTMALVSSSSMKKV